MVIKAKERGTEKRTPKEATLLLKIKKMEKIARAMEHIGTIKLSHIFNLSELRDILHPNEEVAFHIMTLKVLDDGNMPLVVIDIFVKNKLVTIDLSKLILNKEIENYFISMKVLPKNYFRRMRRFSEAISSFPDIEIVGDVGEYYPTCYPN